MQHLPRGSNLCVFSNRWTALKTKFMGKVLHIYGKTKALHHCGNYCTLKMFILHSGFFSKVRRCKSWKLKIKWMVHHRPWSTFLLLFYLFTFFLLFYCFTFNLHFTTGLELLYSIPRSCTLFVSIRSYNYNYIQDPNHTLCRSRSCDEECPIILLKKLDHGLVEIV